MFLGGYAYPSRGHGFSTVSFSPCARLLYQKTFPPPNTPCWTSFYGLVLRRPGPSVSNLITPFAFLREIVFGVSIFVFYDCPTSQEGDFSLTFRCFRTAP